MFHPDPYFFTDSMPGIDIAKIGNKNVLIILKNGQTSIKKYCKDNNFTISQIDHEYIDNSKYIVDVFFRHPISRYRSALKSLKEQQGIIIDKVPLPHTINSTKYNTHSMSMFVDPHIYPQYWYLFQCYLLSWCSDNLYFRFNDFKSIGNLVGNVHENKRSHLPYQPLSDSEMDLLKKRYYFDTKIYQNLLNKTVNYNDLISYFITWIDNESDMTLNQARWVTYVRKYYPENFKE